MTTVLAVLGCVLAAGAAFLPLRRALFVVVTVAGALVWAGAVWQGGVDEVRPLVAACVFLAALLTRRLLQDRRRAENLLRAERATRAASAEVAALGERERIARDLHDSLTHLLTSQLVVLQTARAALTDADTIRAGQRLDAGIGLSRRTLTEARDIVDVLRGSPPDLTSLCSTAREWGTATGRRVELNVPDLDPPLDGACWGALLATLREALTNVTRHSTAQAVRVEVTASGEQVRLLVSDHGPARAVEQSCRSGHGVQGLRERAALLQGRLHAGPVGTGWQLELTLPSAPDNVS